MKEPSLADDLFLVALDTGTGRHRVAERLLSLGLAGGLLGELLLDKAITLVDGKPRPAEAMPGSGLTHMIRDRIAAEPNLELGTWLLYLARSATAEVAERLRLAGWISPSMSGGWIRRGTTLYDPTSSVVSPSIDWRAIRLSIALGASQAVTSQAQGIRTWSDAALVALCHAIGLTEFLLRDGGPTCRAYLDDIHLSMAQQFAPMHLVATRVGELVGSATFTNT